ncbi:TPA: Hsp20/alpha crystallin family protein, partial [Candidatus Bipolaricaulota bacterium]|nr:Hsp20/alpha crystallin family protein [Candidatus Bipolaricaulota bacterium]
MALTRWDPFREMMSLREAIDQLFEESFVRPSRWLMPRWEGVGTLPIDMYETDEAVVVKASIPGIKPEDLDISVAGDTLTIKGETRAEEEVKRENYYCRERRFGAFGRSVTLPVPVVADKAEAVFENGVLTLT